jgi:hypothetical protein
VYERDLEKVATVGLFGSGDDFRALGIGALSLESGGDAFCASFGVRDLAYLEREAKDLKWLF